MTYVIAEACIDVKDAACTKVCPVDCIYEGGRMFYIHPDECIDCGVCLSVCPVEAIYPDDDRLPDHLRPWLAANREFFGPLVTGWGSPGGLSDTFKSEQDHPMVTARAKA